MTEQQDQRRDHPATARRREQPIAATAAAASVFRAVLTSGPLLRTQLTKLTGLSQPTVAKVTRSLIDDGYLVERPGAGTRIHGTRVGRPATPLDVRADREFFIGVKVTSDELIGVLTDLRAGVRATRRAPIAGHRVPDVVAGIRRLVAGLRGESARTRARTYGLGVSVAGDVDRDRGIARFEPFHGWREVPLAALLSRATGLDTVVDNDIRALTEVENWFGAGARAESFLLVAIGSGVTCGLVIDGRVRAGAYGVAGELGHLTVDRNGPKCYCGARGCLEAVASEPAIVRRVADLIGDPASIPHRATTTATPHRTAPAATPHRTTPAATPAATPTPVAAPHRTAGTPHRVVDLARAIELARGGDPQARRAFAEAGHAIGLAVGGVINLVGPELVVLSANPRKGFDLMEGHVRAAIAAHAYGRAARVEILVRSLPFEEWARGAATVAIARRVTAATAVSSSRQELTR